MSTGKGQYLFEIAQSSVGFLANFVNLDYVGSFHGNNEGFGIRTPSYTGGIVEFYVGSY